MIKRRLVRKKKTGNTDLNNFPLTTLALSHKKQNPFFPKVLVKGKFEDKNYKLLSPD